ncbi:dynamin-related protein 4C-like protein [Tanacetum coccineum]|uniref:Dynamin-related protein 4C-like protein n=1 Tax=Tanacetum coccineum TaxID=301880 RepID=A0ABQ4YIA0_9ASTR
MLKQKYLASHDTVLLNVVAANSLDFVSAHSLTMLNEEMLDKMLLVITCSEDSPSNTLEMVKDSYYWNPGLGVAFIRHRSRKENHSLAVHKEKELFRTHRDLSLIDKSIVGIPQLVHKLGSIQSVLLANCLPRMCHSPDDRINKSIVKLDSLAPPTSLLVAFLKALSPFIQNTLSPFLDFNHDDPSHPKCLLKLLNQSRVEADFKSKFILAFENHYNDDHLTSISKAASYAVKLLKKKHTRSLLEFLEGEKMARYKSDTRIEDSIKHLLAQGLNEFRRCVGDRSQKLKLKYYDGYINVSSLHATPTDVRENASRLKVSLFRYLPTVYKGIVDATALHFQTLITTLAEHNGSHILQAESFLVKRSLVEYDTANHVQPML